MGFYVTEEHLEDVPRAEARGNENPHRGPKRRVESGYRFYHPELGRWINRDMIEERGGLNVYAMAGNRVISIIDYMGLATISFTANSLSDLNMNIEQEVGFFENCLDESEQWTFQQEVVGKLTLGGGVIPGGATLETTTTVTIGPMDVPPCKGRKVIGIMRISTNATKLPLAGAGAVNISIGHRLEGYNVDCDND